MGKLGLKQAHDTHEAAWMVKGFARGGFTLLMDTKVSEERVIFNYPADRDSQIEHDFNFVSSSHLD